MKRRHRKPKLEPLEARALQSAGIAAPPGGTILVQPLSVTPPPPPSPKNGS